MIYTSDGEEATHWWYTGDGGWAAVVDPPSVMVSQGRRTLAALPIDQPPKDGLLTYFREPGGWSETTRAEEFSP